MTQVTSNPKVSDSLLEMASPACGFSGSDAVLHNMELQPPLDRGCYQFAHARPRTLLASKLIGVGDYLSDIYAITSYYNPEGFASRLRNYRLFRDSLRADIPLITAELSPDGRYSLGPDDADVLFQLQGDAFWQKERLLNVALGAVPDSASAVAWLDSDIVFESETWPEETLIQLQNASIAQLFDRVSWRGPSDDSFPYGMELNSWRSIVYEHLTGVLDQQTCTIWRRTNDPSLPIGDGYAWAARTDLLRGHGIYDACIAGGGTRAVALASMGRIESLLAANWMTDGQRHHLERWALPFAAAVAAKVAYVPGVVRHLWHGNITDRQYFIRDYELQSIGFDPSGDIQLNRDGCWVWAPECSDLLKDWFEAFFARRHEDG